MRKLKLSKREKINLLKDGSVKIKRGGFIIIIDLDEYNEYEIHILNPYDTEKLREEMQKLKIQKINEKIKKLVEVIANKEEWAFYKISNIDVILDDDNNFAVANIAINYRDKNGTNEQLVSTFTKITKREILKNAVKRELI